MKKSAHGTRAQHFRPLRVDSAVDAAARELGSDRESLLTILRSAEGCKGHLDQEVLGATADALRISDARVAGVAGFYSMLATEPRPPHVIRLCDGPACRFAGAAQLREPLEQAAKAHHGWCVERTSCLGLCDRAPAALVDLEPCGPLLAHRIDPVFTGWRSAAPDYRQPLSGEVRVAMAGLAGSDCQRARRAPEDTKYAALEAALCGSPEDVLREVEHAGLAGCGGAGFPTGRKWRLVADQPQRPKYIICNADESEPGAFKDRVLLEGNPHVLLEGMALAGYAVGAHEGIIYIRGEYEPAAKRLEEAIGAAERDGRIGEHVCGADFAFTIDVHRGAGAYICGEETALLESLEGRRGEPRFRPPFPTIAGFRGLPTVVNNVETLCKVPAIVRKGAAWFRSIAAPNSPGTRLFSLAGHVRRPGVFEVPYGRTLRDLIFGMGLGMRSGSQFKMALIGGAAGTMVPDCLLDVPLDSASKARGLSIGCGAVLVFDQSVSAVDLLECLIHFFRVESCGKCTPCRQGTFVAHELLLRILAGNGKPGDVAALVMLAKMLAATSLCGLGKSVAWPIESALIHFARDFAGRGAT